jgi:dephospho-CoA kinase
MKNDDVVSVIAVVGPIAAGKGTAADLLVRHGYAPFNYGDIIYEERTARGLKEERKISNAVGADLRLQFGTNIIAKRLAAAVEKARGLQATPRVLIDGLRHPDEVAWVKEHMGAQVIGVTATSEVRFLRTLARNRVVDPKTLQGFAEVDQEDRGVDSQKHQNRSDECLLLADIVIENNDDDIEVYLRKLHQALHDLGIQTEPQAT